MIERIGKLGPDPQGMAFWSLPGYGRLATIARADTILIMEDGRIGEQGPRALLAADAGSRFAELLRVGAEEAPAWR